MPSRHGMKNHTNRAFIALFFYLLWYGFNFNLVIAKRHHMVSLRNKPFHILFGQFMLWIQQDFLGRSEFHDFPLIQE